MELFGFVGQMPWWSYVIIMLILTHVTIVDVTLYLHRAKTHLAIVLNPYLEHFFRFWIWLTTGMVTKEWVAVHRKHHAKCEMQEDPHSPVKKGIWRIIFLGWWEYNQEAKRPDVLAFVEGDKSMGLPNDWLETNVYTKHKWTGIITLFILQILIFGLPGILIWGVQMIWIPLWAAGVINGIGHYWGYRNADTPDNSRNIWRLGWFIGGEELHNNHHAYPTSAKFNLKPNEFDIGWVYIKILNFFRLVTINPKRVASLPVSVSVGEALEREELLRVFLHHKYYIAQEFKNKVFKVTGSSDDVSSLISCFKQWLEPKTNIKAFELEKWIGEAQYYGHKELREFAVWLSNLHEVN